MPAPISIAEVIKRAIDLNAHVEFVFQTATSYPLEELLVEVKQGKMKEKEES